MLCTCLVGISEAVRQAIMGFGDGGLSGGGALSLASLETMTAGGVGIGYGAKDAEYQFKPVQALDDLATHGVLTHAAFSSPLREPSLSRAVRDVGDLYEAIDLVFQGSGGSKDGGSGGTTSPEGISHLSPASPYFDALTVLRDLSRDGEIASAQRFLDRLLDLAANLALGYSDAGVSVGGTGSGVGGRVRGNKKASISASSGQAQRTASIISGPGVASGGTGNVVGSGSTEAGVVEKTVQQLEALVMRCLRRLASTLRRPEWASATVWTGLECVLRAFAESLKRETYTQALLHPQNQSQSSMSGRSIVGSLAADAGNSRASSSRLSPGREHRASRRVSAGVAGKKKDAGGR